MPVGKGQSLFHVPFLIRYRGAGGGGGEEKVVAAVAGRGRTGMNCIKMGLPGKLIFSKRKGLENSLRESIFREDLFLYNCLQEGGTKKGAKRESGAGCGTED